jgi:glycosyltransferase involved in cell wall biosynthesis
VNIAFYAPLKPPDHPRPSGDRRIARLLIRALEVRGHSVQLASHFRSREARGDVNRQRRIAEVGRKLAQRYVRQVLKQTIRPRPQLWFSYHLYYKAPDWLGPVVSKLLGIPYVVAEASYAPKRDRPPWRMVHHASGAAIAHAQAIVTLNSDDVGCLKPLLGERTERIHRLQPFIDIDALSVPAPSQHLKRSLASRTTLDPCVPWLICAAMMRTGDKLASYELLAQSLTQLKHHQWQLVVLGDGQARAAVHRAFAPLDGRVHWAGVCDAPTLVGWLSAADVYVWPAVNEAFGMAFLEAQACGLPVVAGRTRGVPDVVFDGASGLLTDMCTDAFANGVERLLLDPSMRSRMGQYARRYARERHDIDCASQQLDQLLRSLIGRAQ